MEDNDDLSLFSIDDSGDTVASVENVAEERVPSPLEKALEEALGEYPPLTLDVSSLPTGSKAQGPLKIFTFIWNTESIRLGESLNRSECDQHRQSYLSPFHFACEIADFLPSLLTQIVQEDPDIVAIGFCEDCSPSSYFHSHLLPIEMGKHNYSLIKRNRMIGLGVTTYKALFSFDLKMRGLRTSIYAKNALADIILEQESDLLTDIGATQKEYVCSSMFLRNKGATGSYIRVPQIGTLAFINVHLPFNSEGLLASVLKDDEMIRYNDVLYQNMCFNEIYRHLVLDLEIRPDYVILMGDFNYRLKPITVPDGHFLHPYATAGNFGAFEMAGIFEEYGSPVVYDQVYRHCDELYEQMQKRNIYIFEEGVDNRGPQFFPTCKLVKSRPENYDQPIPRPRGRPRMTSRAFKLGLANQRTPSWCDRILYSSLNSKVNPILCTRYDRFDVGSVMKKSDHAGVVCVFQIERSTQD